MRGIQKEKKKLHLAFQVKLLQANGDERAASHDLTLHQIKMCMYA